MDIRIKVRPEDFIVQECQSILISSSGENMQYTILSLSKKGYTTFETISILADFLNIEQSLIGYAGLKDEDGISYQFISIPIEINIADRVKEFNQQKSSYNKFISVIVLGYSEKKIKIGKLQGNAFRITLRNVPENVVCNLHPGVRRKIIFPNYYDTQRFGLPNMPKCTHLIGEALYNEKFDLAIEYLKKSNPDDFMESIRFSDFKSYFSSLNKSKLSFYYNAFTSQKFNEYLKKAISKKMEYVEKEYDGIKYSMPKNGYDLLSLNEKIETICVPRYEIDKNMELKLKYFYRYSFADTIVHVNSVNEDTVFRGMYAIDVDFFLPSGCYATMAVKQFVCDLENKAV